MVAQHLTIYSLINPLICNCLLLDVVSRMMGNYHVRFGEQFRGGLTLLFFMVMPGLVGGFFRRSRDFDYDILSYAWSDSQVFELVHAGANTGGKFNETYSEGCIGTGNAYINGICASTLYRTLAINFSLTKVNSHFKDDSATPNFSALSICTTGVGGNQTIKSINETICTDITNRANIITEKY